jgi:STE24 endopeptidase
MTSLARPLLLGLLLAAPLVDLFLISLNLRRASGARGVPPELRGLTPRRAAERARRYAVATNRHALLRALLDGATALWLLLGGALPWLDRRLAGAGLDGAHRFVAFLSLTALTLVLLELPLAWWRARAVEAPFGFGQARLADFLGQRARALGLTALLGLPLLYLTWAFMQHGGAAWWLWLFAAVVALQLALQLVWPALAASRLARARPVTGGPLPDRLEALAVAAGFRTGGVYVVDGARRPGHANACVVGLFRPRVLLDDTLLSSLPLEEVAAVTAHEIGHYRLGHPAQRLALSLAGTLAALALLAAIRPWAPLYRAFGFDGPSHHVALLLASMGCCALAGLVSPLLAALSRRQELAADAYAVRLFGRVGALASALERLSTANLANPWPHPWYAAWRYTHPPLASRLVALVRAAAGDPVSLDRPARR